MGRGNVACVLFAAISVHTSIANILRAGVEHRKGVDSGDSGVPASIDASLKKATSAAEQAWALSKQVDVEAKKALKAGSSVAAEIATAKAAAATAKKEDEKATALYYKTRTSAIQAAVFAARAYYDEVKAAGAAADGARKKALAIAAERAEVKAAMAASNAAMPYHAQLLRGQRVVVDYMKKAQALAAAGVSLKKEGYKLGLQAEAYQQNAQLAEASQIMMQAHSLMKQGADDEAQGAKLHAAAVQINGGLPALQMAGQQAAEAAAMIANPLTKDYLTEFHPY